MNPVVLNNTPSATGFADALATVTNKTQSISVAVSYIQMSGWELFAGMVGTTRLNAVRIVFTDQLAITQPAAIRAAIKSGAAVRRYEGKANYHPKVLLGHDKTHKAVTGLVGSANLSRSALINGQEAGLLTVDPEALTVLSAWFDDLFTSQSAECTEADLVEMENNWRLAAGQRARSRMGVRRSRQATKGQPPTDVEPEDMETVEDVLATLQTPLALLNFDQAGNNIRTISYARTVLEKASKKVATLNSKQASELRLLGFIENGALTPVGIACAAAKTDADFCREWCAWLNSATDATLDKTNQKLKRAKFVLQRYWTLQDDVRSYFESHAHSPSAAQRNILQTIELLCNGSELAAELSLDDMKELSPILRNGTALPPHLEKRVMEYFGNKGTRGWSTSDRRVLPLAWKAASQT